MSQTSIAKRPFRGPYLRTLRVVVLIASLCAGGLTLAAGFSKAGDATGSLPGTGRDPVRQSSYAIGDRLKIAVFEQIRPELPSRDAPGKLGASAVERTELSGEYIVQEDGNIYIPLIGPVAVAGASFQDLEHAIAASLGAKLDGSVKIGIQLLEREPIYVAGTVVKTGSYKHIPGMRVLHALILAGAFETASGDQWRILDLAREKERLLKSTERLSRLLVRTELLKGEREEPATPAKPVPAAGTDIKERLAEARILQRVEQAKRAEQEAGVDAALQSYRTELSIQRDKLQQVEENLQGKAERLQSVNKYRERGTTTDITYFQAASDLAEAKERLHDAKAVIAQLEHKISDLQHEKIRLSVEAQVDREREIRDLQIAISEDEATKATLGTLLMRLPGESAAKLANKEFDLAIIRRTPRGLQRSPAGEDSPLEPGDILQVSPSQPGRVVSGAVGMVAR
jgi:protein involved in polysaccharide export with SLBB domain